MVNTTTPSLVTDYELFRRKVVRGVRFDGLHLTIMHGNGNVIAIIDATRSGLPPGDVDSRLAREVCQPFRRPRVDGVAFLSTASAKIRMTYFERDGTHSRMCGNALRCVTRYCSDRGIITGHDFIGTDDGDRWVSARDGVVRVAVGPGREYRKVTESRFFVYSGLPHLVVLVNDLDSLDVRALGARLRYDSPLCSLLGHPEGLHVDFMRRRDQKIAIRTYEVGVEDETLACGTGAAGSAFVAHRIWHLPFPIRVLTKGGEMTVDSGEHGLVIDGVTDYLFQL